ncbi:MULTISPECIES: SUKH-4 family immunity protein [unclassified Streptomyces]|uniref:SUKH-4 family immunity protein n=1 Tax=unclassified Streptomyces TaxID=2593676 RepID=UPI002DD972B7|nr:MULTISPECIES: SUKH-4 family immunity protein [unclassified Streptomyces]WSA95988.1 SUKH-4 family immunity protein [Streptomyces sp. NBC_01795]WSB80404.1 SUKH-4 family immunity protein [Streptomyces sp. NBC_01775]WSS11391.1 SUKH-4 family immunity protein [Streptomyces sp. NBC_01186]WSS40097.1 SUKH-4 family immunity protein [Streptomyces sp. NBC_01187]
MTRALDRETLERRFRPEELVTLPERALAGIRHEPSRAFLRNIGIPVRPTPWFDLIERDEPEYKRLSDSYEEDLRTVWPGLPDGAENWLLIGMIPYEDFALDSGTGALVLFPQDHDEPYVLNTDLASFVRFLCLLEEERPHYDEDFEPDEGEEEGEGEADCVGAARRLAARMREIDPAALEVPHSRWHDILDYIAYPAAR